MAGIKYITEYAHNSLDKYTGTQQKFLDARQANVIQTLANQLTDTVNKILPTVSVKAETIAERARWGCVIRYPIPETTDENASIILLINAEGTSATMSERYLGILELNILANTEAGANYSDAKWLVVYGFAESNFQTRHLKSSNEVLFYIKPTIERVTVTVLSETVAGAASTKATIIDKPELTTLTATGTVGVAIKTSEYLELENTWKPVKSGSSTAFLNGAGWYNTPNHQDLAGLNQHYNYLHLTQTEKDNIFDRLLAVEAAVQSLLT